MINNGTPQWLPEMILSGGTNKYRRNERSVDFCVENEKQLFKIHHLVVWAFPEICGEWFEGAEVDHIDGDPTNNKATNLRVTDRKGNMANPVTREKLEKVWKSDEFRNAQSERMKGDNNPARRCMTDEWRKHMGESRNGRKHTEEAKRKMSEALKGKRGGKNSVFSVHIGYYDNGELIDFWGYREAERKTGINRQRISNSVKKGEKCKEGIQWLLL